MAMSTLSFYAGRASINIIFAGAATYCLEPFVNLVFEKGSSSANIALVVSTVSLTTIALNSLYNS